MGRGSSSGDHRGPGSLPYRRGCGRRQLLLAEQRGRLGVLGGATRRLRRRAAGLALAAGFAFPRRRWDVDGVGGRVGGQVVGGRLRTVEQQGPLVQRGTPWTQHVRWGRLVGHMSYVQHVIKHWLGLGGLDYSTKISSNVFYLETSHLLRSILQQAMGVQ